MKEKIIARLKAKYSGVNLSKTRLEQIASKLESKISEESEIDAKLDELNEVFPFAEVAKQDDRLRTLESKQKAEPPKPGEPPTDPPKTTDPTGDVSELLKGLIESNKALTEKISNIEKKETAEGYQARLRTILKEKNVDDTWLNDPFRLRAIKSQQFKDDDELNAFADEIVTTFEAQKPKDEQNAQSFGLPGPTHVKTGGGDGKGEVSSMMKSYLESKKPAPEKK